MIQSVTNALCHAKFGCAGNMQGLLASMDGDALFKRHNIVVNAEWRCNSNEKGNVCEICGEMEHRKKKVRQVHKQLE